MTGTTTPQNLYDDTGQLFQLVIHRHEWLYGAYAGTIGHNESMLYRPADNRSCCLGLYLRACGVPLPLLKDITNPSDLRFREIPEQARWLLGAGSGDSNVAVHMMETNDETDLNQVIREQKIAEAFATAGVTTVFIGDDTPPADPGEYVDSLELDDDPLIRCCAMFLRGR